MDKDEIIMKLQDELENTKRELVITKEHLNPQENIELVERIYLYYDGYE